MKRLTATRGMYVVAAGLFAALAATAGLALASSASTAIHACVHRVGGGIYVAKKCAKHDRKISWNKTGPRDDRDPKGQPGRHGQFRPAGPRRHQPRL